MVKKRLKQIPREQPCKGKCKKCPYKCSLNPNFKNIEEYRIITTTELISYNNNPALTWADLTIETKTKTKHFKTKEEAKKYYDNN